jgi:mannosylglycerate hydrolase
VNREVARRVRAVFPLRHPLSSVMADGPFGPVERSPWAVRRHPKDIEAPDPCAPMQRYVSIAGVKDALTVFSDGLPQYEAKADGTLFVTLLRAFTQLSRRDLPERPGHAGWPTSTPEGACLGPVHARLAVMLHAPEMLDQREPIEVAADAFLSPPVAYMRRALMAVPPEVAGPELSGEGLVFSAMKPADTGEGVILRCYNDTSEIARGAWAVAKSFTSAMRCRLDETPTGKLVLQRGRVTFEAGPREIVTILLRP